MAKEKKISYENIDKMTKHSEIEDYTPVVEINGVEIHVKYNITLQDRIDFINDVKEITFMRDKDGVTDYRASLEELAMRFALYKYFTDIKMDNFERVYELLCDRTVFETVYDANRYHMGIMISAARNEIAYRKQELLSFERAEIARMLKNSAEQTEKIAEITEEFKDFDMSQIVKLAQAVDSKSEAEIVNNVLGFREKETEKKE